MALKLKQPFHLPDTKAAARPAIRVAAALILLAGCSKSPVAGADLKVEKVAYWNELALYLSGKKQQRKNAFSAIEDEDWQTYKVTLDSFWSDVETKVIAPVTDWQKTTMLDRSSKNEVLYPLSGADFFNAHLFYPEASRFNLVALEPVGKLPHLYELDKKKRQRALNAVFKAIQSIAQTNYLYSSTMENYFNEKFTFYGVSPALMMLVSRLGYHIYDLKEVFIDKDGNQTLTSLQPGFQKTVKAVVIFFGKEQQPGRAVKSVTYHSMGISPETLGKDSPLARSLNKEGSFNLIMKSAVYLLHNKEYEPVVSYLLDRANFIVQDDSGIPFRFLNGPAWQLAFYGSYRDPVKIWGYGYYPQKDLKEKYAAQPVKKLPFDFGYGLLTKKNESNILMARKSKP